ncbi:MAG: GGDEF domain-containing protein [Deltaproteobacteria bacterium]|nr:GGDEF domain-containing protein [Deltaproteobacteria bacterium]
MKKDTKDANAELKQLKKEFLEVERANRDEKDSLIKVVRTFGAVVATYPEMMEECESLQKLITPDSPLPLDLVESELKKLKDKIIARDQKSPAGQGPLEQVETLKARILESRRIIARIMLPVLEDFYPLTPELAADASSIRIGVKDEDADLGPAATAYLAFLKSLGVRIQEDFRYVNSSFVSLLNHIKELEKTLSKDFGSEENLKQVDYFEMQVSEEVGSIVNSFNVYNTVTEIKSAVIEKIDNIKRIIALKKEEEKQRLHAAQENIHKLQRRIVEAEREAVNLAKKAKEFRTAAVKDGLTGLYNRKAFDLRLVQALETFARVGTPFSLMLFDVDDFKTINDTFGHVAGDKVLQKVAQSLRDAFRKGDFIARFGGDEFAAVIEDMTEEMGRERISNFQKHLGKIRFTSYKKGDILVKVSAGISFAVSGDTPESLLERADRAMYGAKPRKENRNGSTGALE